jgi:hypothetical protein
MNPRLRIFSLICCGVALPCLVLFIGSLAEPRYRGRSLSHWLLAYRVNYLEHPVEQREAAEAVRQIGTNALPCLLKWVRYQEPAWRTRVYMQIWRIKWNKPKRWIFKLAEPLKPCRPERPDALARTGFEILGPAAEPALPELIALASDPHPACRVSTVIYCAAQIGPASFPPLTNILTSSNSSARVRCAIADQIIGDRALALASAPALILAARDSDLSVAVASRRALEMIGAREMDRVTLSREEEIVRQRAD